MEINPQKEALETKVEAPTSDVVNQTVASAPVGVSTSQISGLNGPMPEELKGLNWGAFLLTLFWSISHSIWLGLLTLVPIINGFIPFIMLFKGNEWAWEHRKFESIEQFRAIQKAWTIWSLSIFAFVIIFAFILGMAMGSA